MKLLVAGTFWEPCLVGWIFGKGHLIYVWFKFTKWNNRRLYNIFWNFHISASFQVLAWNRCKHVALLNRLVGPKSFPSCNKVTMIMVKNVQTSTGTQICHNRSLLMRDQYLLIYNCEISTFLSVSQKVNENNTKGTAIVLSMFMLSFIFVIACMWSFWEEANMFRFFCITIGDPVIDIWILITPLVSSNSSYQKGKVGIQLTV